MESITWFGHWLWVHWFIRRDGAWLFRISLPGKRAYTLHSGITLPAHLPPLLAGYYYELSTMELLGFIRLPGLTEPFRVVLAYIEPSPRLERWVMSMP